MLTSADSEELALNTLKSPFMCVVLVAPIEARFFGVIMCGYRFFSGNSGY
jgi:hypothetical protein